MIDNSKKGAILFDSDKELREWELLQMAKDKDLKFITKYECQRDTPKFVFNENGEVVYRHNIVAQIHKQAVTEAITKAIIDYVVDNKIDELYLIDEDFVKTALENEIKRRTER